MGRYMNSKFNELKFGSLMIRKILKKIRITYKRSKINPERRNTNKTINIRYDKSKQISNLLK
jgi:hypothetical protein